MFLLFLLSLALYPIPLARAVTYLIIDCVTASQLDIIELLFATNNFAVSGRD